MTRRRLRARRPLLLAAVLLAGVFAAPRSAAQSDPIGDIFAPPTTAAPKPQTTTSTTAPPAGASAPDGAQDAKGDGVAAPKGGIEVPPEAQRIIDAVRRSRPSSTESLVAGLGQLTALGLSEEEAYRVGFGRFPVAGIAHYTHDWLFPRYGPGFRFHLGCDVMAAYGTPVRSPVDGVASSSRDTLGGLTARVRMPDRTAFAFAHLSALVDGFPEGQEVKTGDILGYVGDSGNAKGGSPHVHLAVYPKGGPPADPKPVLDSFLHAAEAALPQIVANYAASRPAPALIPVPLLPVSPDARLLRPALSTRLIHGWTSGGDAWTPTALYLIASNPSTGAGILLQDALDQLVGAIDWATRPATGGGASSDDPADAPAG